MPHLDYDTVLFAEGRQAVGSIFEVFGPVCDTMYALRFNTAEEASSKMPVGSVVYYAPEGGGNVTKLVLATELLR